MARFILLVFHKKVHSTYAIGGGEQGERVVHENFERMIECPGGGMEDDGGGGKGKEP